MTAEVEFVWGTFCKNVLRGDVDQTEKSIIGVLSALKIGIEHDKLDGQISMSLPTLFFFASCRRKGPTGRAFSTSLNFNLAISDVNTIGVIPMSVPADIINMEVTVQLILPMVNLSAKTGTSTIKASLTILNEGDEIGKVDLPIKIIVKNTKQE